MIGSAFSPASICFNLRAEANANTRRLLIGFGLDFVTVLRWEKIKMIKFWIVGFNLLPATKTPHGGLFFTLI